MAYIKRAAEDTIARVSKMFPVLLVTGPRQVGKTTLLQRLADIQKSEGIERKYVTLDDPDVRYLAKHDPALFLQRYSPPVLIDEIQYATELLPYIKMSVDRSKRKGDFWITGSQVFRLMKNVSESLAGRVGIINLLGLSDAEIYQEPSEPFQTDAEQLMNRLSVRSKKDLNEIYRRIFKGSMPELYADEYVDWETYYRSYVDTYLQRDIRDLAQVADEMQFYNFMTIVAAQTSKPVVYEELASAAGIARYAADSCTQSRMYRQLAAQTENFPGDTVSTGNDFLPQYQALYAQNSDLAGWIQIDGTNINYPVMQSKHDPDFYLKHNFEKADSPHGCPYVQANCDLQTPSDNILVYGHNMKDGTMFSDLLQYKRESFWEQHRIIRFDTLTAQAEYTVMAVFRGEAEDLFAYYQFADAETPQEFAAYVDACKNASLYETGVTAVYGDKLLTLSTCDDSGKNSRMVIVAKRITEPR